MKGTRVQAKILKMEGVEWVSLFPDAALADALAEEGIRTIMPRTERVAVNIADGFSRICNGKKIGVCSMQSAAGIENSFAGVAQANADSTPILVLPTGNARRDYKTLPMIDVPSSFRPITKWTDTILSVQHVPELMRRAFTYLRSGRPGPVLLDLPSDVGVEELEDSKFGYTPVKGWKTAPDPRDVAAAVHAISKAQNPVILAGQGILYAEAWDDLKEFAELTQIPVATTLCGKSSFPENHPLSLGLAARMRTRMAEDFFSKADLIFAAGASLTRHFLNFPSEIPSQTKIIVLTNDEYDINKHHMANLALLGDAKLALRQMVEEAKRTGIKAAASKSSGNIETIRKQWMKEWMPKMESSETPINPLRIMWDLMHTIDRKNSIVIPESGSSRNSLGAFWEVLSPRTYIGWGNTTTMGASLGFAMGAKLAAPGKLVVNVMGDGAFGMVGMDFETSVREKIPILTIVSNNHVLSSLRLWPVAHKSYGLGRTGGSYADVAEALGGYGEKVEHPDGIIRALKNGIKSVQSGRSALLEFVTKVEGAVSTHTAPT